MNKKTEIWKPIEGFEGLYEISNYGRVKSLERKTYHNKGYRQVNERILKGGLNADGYRMVILRKNNKSHSKCIHRLVWDAFGDKPRNGRVLQIDHVDGNKLNNHIDNLQLLTTRANVSKGYKNKKKTSQYTGVFWSEKDQRWVANMWINGKTRYLGYFKNEYDAHIAYENKLKELKE